MESKESKRRKDKYSDNKEYNKDRGSKRRRSRSRTPKQNRDRSPRQKRRYSKSPPSKNGKNEERRNDPPEAVETKPANPVRKTKETDMLNTRTGGAYIPPARLRMMQAQITDKSSVAYQRLAWEALKKSIHGHINKINVGNIGIIIKELLKENIVRGRGLLCRSVIQAQAASPTFTNVYAALVAAVNSRFPNIGELLLKRLVIQFKRGFKRNDKPTCISSASFIAHLVNQRVAHEILALELLTLLVETPTDDSVEVAIAFLKECGQKLTEVSSKGVNAIFEMLRNILHEGQLDKRVQYMIEVMFQVWKDGFKDHPAVLDELELVPEEEQFTHLLMLDDATDSQDILNVFKFDDKYEENEQKYKTLSKEILGSEAESGEEDGSDESGSEESDEDEEEGEKKDVTIIDKTETNLVALRRTIYLTINSSLDFEECAHKLMKMQLKPGQEIELCHMFLDCCAEQRTYEKFYGLLAQRFCNINRIYIGPFEEIFKDSYATAHRLDTNRLRNVSKFFAHLLFTDSISWEVLECVKLNEEDTTSSSRIYIKILFQELAEYMGLKKLNDRLKDPTLQEAFSGVFPRDNPKNTRFSINFFTSIGLGGLTDELREHLKQMPKNVPAPVTEINIDSETSSDSSSSSSSSSSSDDSSSDSEEDKEKQSKTKKSKKDKSKKPKTPEPEVPKDKEKEAERWGHDGFYDTYGPGARRTEPNRSEQRTERGYERGRQNNYDQSNGRDQRNRDRDRRRDRSRERYREDDTRRRRDEDEPREDRSNTTIQRSRDSEKENEREERRKHDKRNDKERYEETNSRSKDKRRDDEPRKEARDVRDKNNKQSRDDRIDYQKSSRDDRNEKKQSRDNRNEHQPRDDKDDYRKQSRDERNDYQSREDCDDNRKQTRDERNENKKQSNNDRNEKQSRDDRNDNRKQTRDEKNENKKQSRDDRNNYQKPSRDRDDYRQARDDRIDYRNQSRDERNEYQNNSRNDRIEYEKPSRGNRNEKEKLSKDDRNEQKNSSRDDRDNKQKRNSRVDQKEKQSRDDKNNYEKESRDDRIRGKEVEDDKERKQNKKKIKNKKAKETDTDSDSSSGKEKKKRNKKKQRKDSTSSSSSSSSSDSSSSSSSESDAQSDNNQKAARYWDTFDISNHRNSKEGIPKFEGKTEKSHSRRKER